MQLKLASAQVGTGGAQCLAQGRACCLRCSWLLGEHSLTCPGAWLTGGTGGCDLWRARGVEERRRLKQATDVGRELWVGLDKVQDI
eukprot:766748-Hanusia_phi.AAC.13